MWAYRMAGPGVVERVEVAPDTRALRSGQVRLRFRAGGLCGSDMPRFNAIVDAPREGTYDSAPLHELVADVLESASEDLKAGQRVVGMLGSERGGLAEIVVSSADNFIPVPDELEDPEAVVVQSLGTVVRAATQFPDLHGARVAVIGAGSCGLLFCHLLKHDLGVAHLTAVDPVDRKQIATAYGADEFLQLSSGTWSRLLEEDARPQAIVEVVGHQQRTMADAIRAVAPQGFVFGFGAPDDPDYVFPYGEIYHKDLTVASGMTRGEWRRVLGGGLDYLLRHRSDLASFVSHVLPVSEAQRAYSLYARPQHGRLKVVLTAG